MSLPLNIASGLIDQAGQAAAKLLGGTSGMGNGANSDQAESAFAELLGSLQDGQNSTSIQQSSEGTIELSLGEFELAFDTIDLSQPETLNDLLAGAIQLLMPNAATDQAVSLEEFTQGLKSLGQTLQEHLAKLSGEIESARTLTPELQQKVENALGLLKSAAQNLSSTANEAGIELPGELKALLQTLETRGDTQANADLSAASKLQQARTDLDAVLQSLGAASNPSTTNAATQDVALRAQLMNENANLAERNGLALGSAARTEGPHAANQTNLINSNAASAIEQATNINAQATAQQNGTLSGVSLDDAGLIDAKTGLPIVTISPANSGSAPQVTPTSFQPFSAPNAFQQANPINIPQMGFEIARMVEAGNSRFQMRLDPPELGRIDVRMEINKDGAVMARLAVERAETLDLLSRDARALEKALADAGLDAENTSLEFSLAEQGQDSPFGDDPDNSWLDQQTLAETPETPQPAQITQSYQGVVTPGGVNLIA